MEEVGSLQVNLFLLKFTGAVTVKARHRGQGYLEKKRRLQRLKMNGEGEEKGGRERRGLISK